MTRYNNGKDEEADKIIQRCLEENRAPKKVPSRGPLVLQAGDTSPRKRVRT